MKLETVKFLSRNPALRGNLYDVYFRQGDNEQIELVAVEELNSVTNLMSSFSDQDKQDALISLIEVLDMRRIRAIAKEREPYLYEDTQKLRQENKEKGWSNE